jgi:aspartate aminotransferase
MFYALVERAFALEKQGKRLIKLHIGETNLPTPQCAGDAAAKAIARGHSDYGPAAGLPLLRERLARREGCAPENVVVGPGSKHLIFALMSVLGRPGAKVAMPTPGYPAYPLIARQLGMEPMELRTTLESGWQFDPAALEGALLAAISNPVNPTSTVYPAPLLERAAERMRANGGYLILDEAYRGLAFEPIADLKHPAALRVRSFSKEFNMEGWRLGYAVVPKAIAQELVRFNQITATCVPDFVQEAGAACLEQEPAILERHRAIWKERSQAAQRVLAARGFSFAPPGGAMYVFPTHPAVKDSGALALELLERGVAVAPGSGFGQYPSFVRICVNQEAAVLERAIGELHRAAVGERT